MRFKDKVAIVTGAASGIGRATALRFAEEGANVAIPDINEQGANETADSIRQLGRQALAIKTDVSSSEQVRRSIAQTLQAFGQIDIVVNDAGINVRKSPHQFTDEEWRRVLGINLDGVWYYCRYVLDHFLERGRGNIVNIASVGAFQTSHNRVPYMASKGGVVSLTKALALDLADRNIRVNAVAPGCTDTGFATGADRDKIFAPCSFLTPMGRWAQPVEIANAVLFLASDEASYITGHILCVDGGMMAGNPLGRPFPAALFQE